MLQLPAHHCVACRSVSVCRKWCISVCIIGGGWALDGSVTAASCGWTVATFAAPAIHLFMAQQPGSNGC